MQASATPQTTAPLHGRVAIVTGSTSGIGLGIARALASAGADIVLNGLGNPEDIERTRSELAQSANVQVAYNAANLLDGGEAAGLVTSTIAQFGKADILVNNAGIQHVSPIEDFPPEKFEAILAINLSAPWYLARAVVPAMKARKWGRIISTASAHSLVASPNKSAYVMAKHGIAGMTKTLALETATFGVTVNAISPGYVWTPLVEAQIPDTMKARGLTREQVINDVLLDAQPTKQFVTSAQVASLALYLCRDEAAQITGANLSIDGGWTAA